MQRVNTNGRRPQGPTVATVYWMLSRATVARAAHMLPSQHEARWPQEDQEDPGVREGRNGWMDF